MGELILLLFLLWAFGKFSKKGKTKVHRKEKAEQERKARIQQELQSLRQIKQTSIQDVPQTLGEGESHMAYTADVHGCVSERKEYMGSLSADSSEGEDACDLSLEHERETVLSSESVYAGEIGAEPVLDLSARGIYQGVVMSEVLNRPARYMRSRS